MLATLLGDISTYFFYQEIMIWHITALYSLKTRCLSGDMIQQTQALFSIQTTYPSGTGKPAL